MPSALRSRWTGRIRVLGARVRHRRPHRGTVDRIRSGGIGPHRVLPQRLGQHRDPLGQPALEKPGAQRFLAVPADEFLLTRFLISCCVADALTVQVRIVDAPPGEFKQDQWVRVTGRIYPLGREVLVDATDVVGIARPERPYLTP